MIVPFLYVADPVRGYQLSTGLWKWLQVRGASAPPSKGRYQKNKGSHSEFDSVAPDTIDKLYLVFRENSSSSSLARLLKGSGATLWDCSGCDEGSIVAWLEANWR